jgi:hypothetical protein
MNLTGIISIAGKPGLFKIVAQGKNNIIVESLNDNKRIPAYSTDRISALEDISIYTYEEDVPLVKVYTTIFKKENGGKAPSHKDSVAKLEAYLEEVLPDYDKERVYPSDIKKLFQWYNLLVDANLLNLEDDKDNGEEKDKGEEVDAKEKEDVAEETISSEKS